MDPLERPPRLELKVEVAILKAGPAEATLSLPARSLALAVRLCTPRAMAPVWID